MAGLAKLGKQREVLVIPTKVIAGEAGLVGQAAGLLQQLVAPLEGAGRVDLAREIKRKLLRQRLRGYGGRLKRRLLRHSKPH